MKKLFIVTLAVLFAAGAHADYADPYCGRIFGCGSL